MLGRGVLRGSESPRAAVLVLCALLRSPSGPDVDTGAPPALPSGLFSLPGTEVLAVVSAGEVKDRALWFTVATTAEPSRHTLVPWVH